MNIICLTRNLSLQFDVRQDRTFFDHADLSEKMNPEFNPVVECIYFALENLFTVLEAPEEITYFEPEKVWTVSPGT